MAPFKQMRRSPGEWVRWQARKRLVYILAAVAGLMGFAAHFALDRITSLFLGQGWAAGLSIALMLAAIGLMIWLHLYLEIVVRWLKGADAETYVGQVIEYAIAAPNCAAAHSVTGLSGSGDIDHLVATPADLWIVETKAAPVPRRLFPRVLERLASQARAVREWAPPGTAVRCCLVLENPQGTRRQDYERDGERVAVHTPGSLRKALAAEATGRPHASPELARAVWELGRQEQ